MTDSQEPESPMSRCDSVEAETPAFYNDRHSDREEVGASQPILLLKKTNDVKAIRISNSDASDNTGHSNPTDDEQHSSQDHPRGGRSSTLSINSGRDNSVIDLVARGGNLQPISPHGGGDQSIFKSRESLGLTTTRQSVAELLALKGFNVRSSRMSQR